MSKLPFPISPYISKLYDCRAERWEEQGQNSYKCHFTVPPDFLRGAYPEAQSVTAFFGYESMTGACSDVALAQVLDASGEYVSDSLRIVLSTHDKNKIIATHYPQFCFTPSYDFSDSMVPIKTFPEGAETYRAFCRALNRLAGDVFPVLEYITFDNQYLLCPHQLQFRTVSKAMDCLKYAVPDTFRLDIIPTFDARCTFKFGRDNVPETALANSTHSVIIRRGGPLWNDFSLDIARAMRNDVFCRPMFQQCTHQLGDYFMAQVPAFLYQQSKKHSNAEPER